MINPELAQACVLLRGDAPAVVVAFPSTSSADPVPMLPDDNDDPAARFGPRNPFRFGDLTSGGLDAELFEFKRETYVAHITRSEKKRVFVATIPRSKLALVRGTSSHMMTTAAAAAANSLLAQSSNDVQEDRAQGDREALATTYIGVNSTYRSADAQFGLWNKRFAKYLDGFCAKYALPAERAALSSSSLAKYIGARTACPGYSKHQDGLAIDFATNVGGKHLRAGSRNAWTKSWLHLWLLQHAESFGFAPLSGEPWHWNYEGGDA